MNAVTNALVDLQYKIPAQILHLAFRENNDIVNKVIGLDERILNKVVRPRILKDCNLVGGVELIVPLSSGNIKQISVNEFIIEIPKEATNNKSIITALSLTGGTTFMQPPGVSHVTSPVETSLEVMRGNLATLNIIQTSRLEIIGENILIVQDPSAFIYNGFLRCTIENNSNMENISPRSYIEFSTLVEFGVKSYIYNTLRVKLDQGYLYGGHELGVINEIISEYADMENMYQTHLKTVWKKVAYMNNGDSVSRLVQSMIGNNL